MEEKEINIIDIAKLNEWKEKIDVDSFPHKIKKVCKDWRTPRVWKYVMGKMGRGAYQNGRRGRFDFAYWLSKLTTK